MLVELVGLPGSGKSALAAAFIGAPGVVVVMGALHPLNSGCRRRLPLWARIAALVRAAAHAPQIAWLLVRIRVAACGIRSLQMGTVATFMLESEAFRALTKSDPSELLLLEEGPVQWMFSLTFGGNPEAAKADIASYFGIMYRARAVKHIYLRVTAAECARRVRAREQTATLFTKEAPAAVIDGLLSYPFSILLDGLVAAKTANVFVVNAEQPFESVSADLRRLMAATAARS